MTINQYNFAGKKAIVRVDFNVPLDENGNITDDTRIKGALPTLKKIIADGGAAIIMSHRADRQWKEGKATESHETARKAKMLTGFSICIGLILFALLIRFL